MLSKIPLVHIFITLLKAIYLDYLKVLTSLKKTKFHLLSVISRAAIVWESQENPHCQTSESLSFPVLPSIDAFPKGVLETKQLLLGSLNQLIYFSACRAPSCTETLPTVTQQRQTDNYLLSTLLKDTILGKLSFLLSLFKIVPGILYAFPCN